MEGCVRVRSAGVWGWKCRCGDGDVGRELWEESCGGGDGEEGYASLRYAPLGSGGMRRSLQASRRPRPERGTSDEGDARFVVSASDCGGMMGENTYWR